MKPAISFAGVRSAAHLLKGVTARTPVLTSRTVDDLTGCKVYFKCENFQKTGSFKFRGAYNALAQVRKAERNRGVITISSGNHGQGLALAAKLLGSFALIAMPDDVPENKIAATKSYGAEVRTFDRQSGERERFVDEMVHNHGLTFIHPYDDPHVMAGQGTVALEFLQDVPDLEILIAPVGGGGLLSGCATVARALNPKITIFGVETENANDWSLSLQKGERVRIPLPQTIADGMRMQQPGELTFPIIKREVEGIILVSDTQVIDALRFILLRMKILVEPTAAVAPAAVLQGKLRKRGTNVGVILSGGNIDVTALTQLTSPQAIQKKDPSLGGRPA
ncbi:MAG: pyridoxal-phosphate dependent enzyme [Proteobacteria bacterium]|nr:pyridoxal-phosphate dependent enzyme [Pseudomonadota bacterium]NIS70188.1 pyridoxal-phosphate dependent enzyme [Pseudomonadota bacterium]